MFNSLESATQDRERKILELQRKIVKMYGSSLINFLSYQTPVPVIYREDSPEERQAKLDEIHEIVKEREREYIEREDELILELNKIMQRIREKNSKMEGTTNFYNAAPPPPEIRCPKCGNKVSLS
jgi:precorrin-4 methylase